MSDTRKAIVATTLLALCVLATTVAVTSAAGAPTTLAHATLASASCKSAKGTLTYGIAGAGVSQLDPNTINFAGQAPLQTLLYNGLTKYTRTMAVVGDLATKWRTSKDLKTWWFYLRKDARYSNGRPFTADDARANILRVLDPAVPSQARSNVKDIRSVRVITKYELRIKLGSPSALLPNALVDVKMSDTNDVANLAKSGNGTGPYTVSDADIKKGTSIALRRRKDYWADKYRINIGQYNFDELRSTVVRDQNLAFEMFKRGDLDYYFVNISQVWVQQLNTPPFERGLIVKRKVFNNYPQSTQYLAFNTRRGPWDDLRVRKAFALLFNRQQLIDTIFFKEYEPLNSFYPGTEYENPNNPKNPYDPQQALMLLAEAGWKDRDAQGRLTKNGQPLQIELLYDDKGGEKWMTLYQNDLRKVGITLNLRLVSPETQFKMMMQRQFDLVSGAWGVGSVFPNPRPEYHSSTADVMNTNNISGFKNKRVDEICDQYDVEFDPAKRAALIRELDGILTSQYHYLLEWNQPAQRFAYWNRFGMPQGVFSRVGDFSGTLAPGIPQVWWIDPAKAQRLDQAQRDSSTKLEVPAVEDHYWEQYGKTHQESATRTQ